MKEHSLFLKLGFNCEDTKLIEEANRFYSIFEEIESQALAFSSDVDPQRIYDLNQIVYSAASYIWAFKRKVLGLIIRCKIGGNNFPLLVDHVSREAAYFIFSESIRTTEYRQP